MRPSHSSIHSKNDIMSLPKARFLQTPFFPQNSQLPISSKGHPDPFLTPVPIRPTLGKFFTPPLLGEGPTAAVPGHIINSNLNVKLTWSKFQAERFSFALSSRTGRINQRRSRPARYTDAPQSHKAKTCGQIHNQLEIRN